MPNATSRREKFKSFYTTIRDELLDHIIKEGIPPDAVEWYRKNMDYNLPNGKFNRGTFMVDVIEILQGHPLSEEEYPRAAVLGWCCEFYQAYFLVADDIMDFSITRRGQPCWYRNEEVGMRAINDAFMLEAAIYHLLKVHFRCEPYYADVVDLFHETLYITEMGQLLDLVTAPQDVVDLRKFSLERQNLISKYKTAYSYYFPVALGLTITGIPLPSQVSSSSSNPYEVAKTILMSMGEYYQVQDDFFDFAGPPEKIGKIGTDIVDNKCSWCIVTALNLATPEQRKILEDNYGRKNKECEGRVKEVFEEVGLRRVYAEYEESAVAELRRKIEGVVEGEDGLKKEVFESFLGKIYKRDK
ncbi:isoprenoid synthase domain-containing protein [Cyathus striatus]|nr:isoprenoid synthase domain-containing protein [Cyathus striatus]